MMSKTLAAGLLSLGTLAATAPAHAQYFSFEFGTGGPRSGYEQEYGYRDHGLYQRTLSPRQVRRILRDKGFRQIDYLDRRGSIYQVEATSARGRRVGLVVSARSGAILNRYRL